MESAAEAFFKDLDARVKANKDSTRLLEWGAEIRVSITLVGEPQ